jgi:hypothetical protein
VRTFAVKTESAAMAATIRLRMATNCLPVSAHQFDAAVERATL